MRLIDRITKNMAVRIGVHGAAFRFVFWNSSLMASSRIFSHR